MFNGHQIKEFKTNMSKPLGGITFPDENNSGEVLTFMSNITDCLENVLPAIITNLTQPHHQQYIMNNITLFLKEFKEVQRINRGQNTTVVPIQCPIQITDCNDYSKKKNGLRIIHYARQWVESMLSKIHGSRS